MKSASLTLITLISSVIILTGINGCKHEPYYPQNLLDSLGQISGGGQPCDPDTVYFVNDIQPLLNSYCAGSGCHNVVDQQEEVIMVGWQNVITTGEVKPFKPNNSKMYKQITEGEMPPSGHPQLSTAQKNLIQTWILQGARNNSCSGCDTLMVTYNLTIKPLIQNKCLGCHTGSTPGGGWDLSAYTGVQTVALNGKLFGSVNHDAGYSFMPKNSNQLPQCEIDEIKIWVDAGAPNN